MIGHIYKIVNSENDLIFIGVTTMPLYEVLDFQINNINDENIRLVRLIENIGIDKFNVELIRDVICDTHYELKIHKYNEFSNYNSDMLLNYELITINIKPKIIHTINKSEFKNNTEYIKIYHHKYYQNNKNKLSDNAKLYYQNNKHILMEYNRKYYMRTKINKLVHYIIDNVLDQIF